MINMTNSEVERLELELECEKLRLMSFQLDNLLEEYNQLLELRESIQLKFFTTIENVKKNGIPVDEDYERWEKLRTSEREGWNEEIDLVTNLKYDVDDNLKLLDNTRMGRSMISREID